MNPKQKYATVKAVMTGLMVTGAAVASLGTIGCDRLLETQVPAVSSGAIDEIGFQSGVIKTIELSSKITFNHNETFLIGAFA